MISVLTSIVGLVSTYFSHKTEAQISSNEAKITLSKLKNESTYRILEAKTGAEIKRSENLENFQYSIDEETIRNMDKTWKDEILLYSFLAPILGSFYPPLVTPIVEGFKVISNLPDWYLAILIGMIVTSYGMRSLFREPARLYGAIKGTNMKEMKQ